MLTPLSALKIDAALLALELLQRQGEWPADGALRKLLDEILGEFGKSAPAPGEVSIRDLARLGDVPLSTVHGLDRLAAAKLARGLRDDLPPHMARSFCALIDDPNQPELF